MIVLIRSKIKNNDIRNIKPLIYSPKKNEMAKTYIIDDNKHIATDSDGVKWKMSRFIDKNAKSTHHIMGRMNRIKYNTNIELNKVLMDDREHRALNSFFRDKQNPREQLLKVFNLVKPVLSIGVKQELEIILNCDDDLFYIPELLKGKKQKKTLGQSTESLQEPT